MKEIQMRLYSLSLMGLEDYAKHQQAESLLIQDVKKLATHLGVTIQDKGTLFVISKKQIQKSALTDVLDRKKLFQWIMEEADERG